MDRQTHLARYGSTWWPGEPWVRWTFAALFILAAVLRFWDLPHLPYTHDELSALVRLYPTIGETIQRGVVELDTHPPGVQVFEWFWTRLFGMDEAVVKLPFILLSLLALFLLYRFALAWTSAPTALVITALLASLQYTVMYGQIARPYAIGLFTTAIFADQLTRYLAFDRSRSLVLAGMAAVLSAYTHHFALLLAGLMALTGLLLVQAHQRKSYLIMCVAAMVAYVPNIPLFLKQLSLGGLAEWLAPPDRYWLSDHLRWLSHYSTVLAGILLALIIWAIILRVKQRPLNDASRWFLPLWGLLPIFIGLGYSIWRAPVIQYSMLIFSFPYILMALFAGLRTLPKGATITMSALLAVVATFTLIFQRHHYELFYASKYEAIVDRAVEAITEHGATNTLVLVDAPEPQIRFYQEAKGLTDADFPYIQLRGRLNSGQVDSTLVAAKGKVIVLGITNGSQQEWPARVQLRFPYILERHDLVDGQVFVLADRPGPTHVEDRVLLAEATPGKRSPADWDIHEDLPTITDTVRRALLWDLGGRTFGLACGLDVSKEMHSPRDLFEVVVDVQAPDSARDFAVVLELVIGDSTRLYRTAELNDQRSGGSISLVVAATRADVLRGQHAVRMGAYVYNRSGAAILVKRMRIFRRSANPVQYALIEPVLAMPSTQE